MKTQSLEEIISDDLYAEAFGAAEKKLQKKYSKLLAAAEKFLSNYESSFGEPDGDKEDDMGFFALKKEIEKLKK